MVAYRINLRTNIYIIYSTWFSNSPFTKIVNGLAYGVCTVCTLLRWLSIFPYSLLNILIWLGSPVSHSLAVSTKIALHPFSLLCFMRSETAPTVPCTRITLIIQLKVLFSNRIGSDFSSPSAAVVCYVRLLMVEHSGTQRKIFVSIFRSTYFSLLLFFFIIFFYWRYDYFTFVVRRWWHLQWNNRFNSRVFFVCRLLLLKN